MCRGYLGVNEVESIKSQWWQNDDLHHNEPDGVSNNQPHDCLLNRLFRRRSKKTSKLHLMTSSWTYRPGRNQTLDVSIKVGDQHISPSDDPPKNIGVVHYNDVIMEAIASQITSLTIVYSIVYSDADQRKHQSSASLAFVWGIHRGPVNSPHKWPVTRKMFPFDDVIMFWCNM